MQHLLDASALLALLLDEAGATAVEEIVDDSQIHAVNLAEVVRKLIREGANPAETERRLDGIDVPIVSEMDRECAYFIGHLAAMNRGIGLALGDAVCLAVAARSGARAVTAERLWAEVVWPQEMEFERPEILVIR